MAWLFLKILIIRLPCADIKVLCPGIPCENDFVCLRIDIKTVRCFCLFDIVMPHEEVLRVACLFVCKIGIALAVCCDLIDLFIFFPDHISGIIHDVLPGI